MTTGEAVFLDPDPLTIEDADRLPDPDPITEDPS